MSRIKIFTDSTCDLSKELLEKYDIDVVPLYVSFDSESLKDGVDIDTYELYRNVDETGLLPKTSSPPPIDFYNKFKPYIDNGYEILYVGLSSKLSSTIQNAKIAASEFDDGKIEVVDSLNLSTGVGLLSLKAADLRDNGLNIKEIKETLESIVPKVETNFVIDTLDYLYKGGRCSALQNIVSNVLKIRPIIKVVDGKMIVSKKIRGKRIKALNTLLEDTFKDKDNLDTTRVMVTHSLSDDDSIYLYNQLKEKLNVKEVLITKAGCVISSHCGQNTIGILYIKG